MAGLGGVRSPDTGHLRGRSRTGSGELDASKASRRRSASSATADLCAQNWRRRAILARDRPDFVPVPRTVPLQARLAFVLACMLDGEEGKLAAVFQRRIRWPVAVR